MIVKTAAVGGVANNWYSLFKIAGVPPAIAPANIASNGDIMTDASTGALRMVRPGGGQNKYLLTSGVYVSAQGFTMVMLVDLLWAASNVTANATTGAQTINSRTLTRYPTGSLVMMICSVTTALGATPANLTISYKNQNNTATQSTGAIPLTTSAAANRLQPIMSYCPMMVLGAGDYGVYQILTATVSALMGGGVMDIYLFKPLAIIPTITAYKYNENHTTQQLNNLTPLLYGSDSALGCLGLFGYTGSTTTCTTNAFLRTVIG
jgi:hypothetical protein